MRVFDGQFDLTIEDHDLVPATFAGIGTSITLITPCHIGRSQDILPATIGTGLIPGIGSGSGTQGRSSTGIREGFIAPIAGIVVTVAHDGWLLSCPPLDSTLLCPSRVAHGMWRLALGLHDVK